MCEHSSTHPISLPRGPYCQDPQTCLPHMTRQDHGWELKKSAVFSCQIFTSCFQCGSTHLFFPVRSSLPVSSVVQHIHFFFFLSFFFLFFSSSLQHADCEYHCLWYSCLILRQMERVREMSRSGGRWWHWDRGMHFRAVRALAAVSGADRVSVWCVLMDVHRPQNRLHRLDSPWCLEMKVWEIPDNNNNNNDNNHNHNHNHKGF